jgi:FkbM family methyltransferase
MFWDAKYSMWVHDGQQGLTDRFIIAEVKQAYKELYSYAKDKVVLDIGGNIGATAKHLAKVAKQVIVVEPEPINFAIMQKNLEEFSNVICINAGISTCNGTATLYVNTKNNTGLHTLIPMRGRDKLIIETIAFDKLLDMYKPTALKFDAEGAEQVVRQTLINLPAYVKFIAIEYDVKPAAMSRAGYGRDASIQLFNDVAKQFTEIRCKYPDINAIAAHRHAAFYVGER